MTSSKLHIIFSGFIAVGKSSVIEMLHTLSDKKRRIIDIVPETLLENMPDTLIKFYHGDINIETHEASCAVNACANCFSQLNLMMDNSQTNDHVIISDRCIMDVMAFIGQTLNLHELRTMLFKTAAIQLEMSKRLRYKTIFVILRPKDKETSRINFNRMQTRDKKSESNVRKAEMDFFSSFEIYNESQLSFYRELQDAMAQLRKQYHTDIQIVDVETTEFCSVSDVCKAISQHVFNTSFHGDSCIKLP